MPAYTDSFCISTDGKGTYDITRAVERVVVASGIRTGVCTVFIQHTSASLVVYENADRSARVDLHEFFERLVPEDEDCYTHTLEGADDAASHLRMVLTRTSESIPVVERALALGCWQGIFLFEHRRSAHVRKIVVSVIGD